MAARIHTTFSSDGMVAQDFGDFYDSTSGVTVQSDGKILVAGASSPNETLINLLDYDIDDLLVRYNVNGSLDTTFDADGIVKTNFGEKGSISSVTVQPDGKILAVGSSGSRGFAIARYNTNGSLDTSFDSDGKVTTNFDSISTYDSHVTVQPDGKILVLGGAYNGTNKTSGTALARYNIDGSLDTSFDSDGKVITYFDNQGRLSSFTIQPDGKILALGYSGIIMDKISPTDFYLARYNTDGSLDTSFDSDGKLTTDFGDRDYGESVTVQSDGKILVAGYSSGSLALARYNTDGSLDTSFDSDGKLTILGGGGEVIIQTNGKILVGSSGTVLLTRYNADGSLDASITDSNLDTSTADITAPTITTFSPTDESASVGVSDNIVLTFDEAIQKGKGNIVLMTSAGKTVQSFNIATSTAVSISGDTLTINPSKDLSYDTGYKLKMVSGAITDTSNNKYTDDLSSYNFTTTDTLTTSASSYTLPKKGANNLTYLGSNDFTGKGNVLANVITGSSGNDALNGGLGNDTLTGGAGNDTFVFDTKPNASTNIDSITDFISGSDDIYLSKKLFTAYRTAGADLTNDLVMASSIGDTDGDGVSDLWDITANGVVGGNTKDTSDHFLFDPSTGALYYDADGSGSKAAVQFATLTGIATLVANDLHIY